MKILFITNILFQANRICQVIKDKTIQLQTLVINGLKFPDFSKMTKEFDMFIIDLPTPSLKEIIHRIKEIDKDKPIIVLGNEESYKDIIEISKLGISKYLKKPFDPVSLLNFIKELNLQEEITEKSSRKGFAIYTRTVNNITIINILGHLQSETVEEIKKILEKSDKVAISLNGISSLSLDINALKEISNLLKSKGENCRIILVREKIKNLLLEEGIKESLIYPNEFLAVRSFS